MPDSRRAAERPVIVSEVQVRPARAEEWQRWDALMNEHHPLGFKRFAGRGQRYVAEWRGRWLALAGWQTGVHQCAPRDKWLGWHRAVQFRRLHLIANNTRFLILPAGEGLPNLASRVLGRNLRRLSADWQQRWGHPLELAETFVDPEQQHRGTCYLAANWVRLGYSKGYARSNGKYTSKHGHTKVMLAYPLRPDARERLADPEDQPEWHCKAVNVRHSKRQLRGLRDLLDAVPDPRGCRGKRHPLGVVLTLLALAKLAGREGGRAAEQYAKSLNNPELEAIGCRRNRTSRHYETPSDTTFQRVMEKLDPDELERVVQQWTRPRTPELRAVAADGKRIRGANKMTGDDEHWETVTLVDHATGAPVASRSYCEKGGEPAALRALLEDVDVSGLVVTLDAGHASRELERILREQHGAHSVLTIKGNCPETHELLQAVKWEREQRQAGEDWVRAHGRWERREIAVCDLHPLFLPFAHARQGFRVRRQTRSKRNGPVTTTDAYGITTLGPERASAQELLQLVRGHWQVENANHYRRDKTFGEDASRIRTGHGPSTNAALNNLALALLILSGRREFDTVPQAQMHYAMRPQEAIDLVLASG